MSYILDALRKAEHDRNVGDTPKLDFSPLSEGAGQRNRVLWVLVGVLGICVGVLGAMQLSEYLAPDAAHKAPPAAKEANAKQDTSAEPKSTPNVVIVAPPEPSRAQAAKPEPAPAPREPQRRSVQVNTPQGPVEIEMPLASEPSGQQEASPPDTTAARQSEPEPEPAPRQAPARQEQSQAAGSEPAGPQAPASLNVPSPAELAAEMENGGGAPAAAQVQAAPEPEPAPQPEPEPEPPVQEERLVSYLGLPAGTRNSIGELTMNAHVYSSTPGRGFCIINGSRYRPGDELKEGPVLQEIRLEGAVLEYRGERFLLPVPR